MELGHWMGCVAVTSVLLAAAGSAAAQGGTLTDQAASLVYGASHWDDSPDASLLGVDPAGDVLFESGWWYRAQGDTREFPLPVPDSLSYLGGGVTAIWNNLGGKGFHVVELTYLIDNEGPSGGFVTYMYVANNNPTPQSITLFHYIDVDMNATAPADAGVGLTDHFIKFYDSASRGSYKASRPSHYQVAAYAALKAQLNNATLTTLSDSGVPFGPGDATAGYQFDLSISAGGVDSAMISFFANPPGDRVKGDVTGVLNSPPLIGQKLDLTAPYHFWMRRTTHIERIEDTTVPDGWAVAGADDFDGDYVSELVLRNAVTGTTAVGGYVITGAPTLPLNWKLSATGDFTSDGKADILWRNTSSQKLVLWRMDGAARTGALVPNPDQAVNANWEVSGAADFNGDGARDILWYNQTSGKIVLWYMDLNLTRIAGEFTTPSTVGNNNWKVVAVGDFGRGAAGVYDTQDIVWQNDTSSKVVVWHMDGNGVRTSGVFTVPDSLIPDYKVVGPR